MAYCGLAPATHQSGAGSPTPKPRHRFNRHLKRAFLLLALAQVRWQPKARAYYDRKRAEGQAHWSALRCLARQLCRITFRMLSRGRPNQAHTAPRPASSTWRIHTPEQSEATSSRNPWEPSADLKRLE